jgi:hypothetical protein
MTTITVEIPDELAEQVGQLRDRLPELLTLSLRQPALPAATYRAILGFLASDPSPAQIAAFAPPQRCRPGCARCWSAAPRGISAPPRWPSWMSTSASNT